MKYVVIPAKMKMEHKTFENYDDALDCAIAINEKCGCSVFIMHKSERTQKWVTDMQLFPKEVC